VRNITNLNLQNIFHLISARRKQVFKSN